MGRILVVDDNAHNLAVLTAHLAPLGHEIACASNGREALAAVAAEEPDIVLLDLMMPDLDGIDVLTHLRAQRRSTHLPVVLVTASTDRDARIRGLESGADDFLEKPVDRAVLLARVRNLLQLQSLTRELALRNAALETLRRAQQEFTNFVVHDMKNPLTTVMLDLAFAREELPASLAGGDAVRALDAAEEAAKRLSDMLGDLLVISRSEAVGLTVRVAAIPLDELVPSVLESWERAFRARDVEVRRGGETGAVVYGDASLVRRVVENLVDNALRHTPRGGRIHVATHPGRLCVANTGKPIPASEAEILFDRFAQGAGPRLRGNVGLGLYFCRCVADAHGGSIAVDSDAEWPVRFTLTLPGSPT